MTQVWLLTVGDAIPPGDGVADEALQTGPVERAARRQLCQGMRVVLVVLSCGGCCCTRHRWQAGGCGCGSWALYR